MAIRNACKNINSFNLNGAEIYTTGEPCPMCLGAILWERINKIYSEKIVDEIINGYISYTGGIRIGVAGEVVTQNNIVKTIKNISSLNIRIPHQIKNCSLKTYSSLVSNNQIKSTLVVSSNS